MEIARAQLGSFGRGPALLAVALQQCSPGAQAQKFAAAGGGIVKGMENLVAAINEHKVTETFVDFEESQHPDLNNPLIVAGAINLSLEAHRLPVAQQWVERAAGNPVLSQNPQVMREQERYLSFRGQYQQSAEVGERVIKVLRIEHSRAERHSPSVWIPAHNAQAAGEVHLAADLRAAALGCQFRQRLTRL